jgi:alkylation response protein AidB-like acyl-CoA dehydrogenase
MKSNPAPLSLNLDQYDADTKVWLDKVDDISGVLEKFRDANEQNRDVDAAVVAELIRTGISRMCVSTAFGGSQVPIPTAMRVIEAIARIDPSVAWQVGVQAAVGRLSDFLPEASAATVFRDQDGIVGGGVTPSGRAERVKGGYLVNGEWAFGSGASAASWMLCTSMVTSGNEPVLESGRPLMCAALVPAASITFRDTWHTLGLRGSGSNHYRVEDTFVPEDLTVTRATLARPPARPDAAYPLGYFDFGPFAESPQALGIATSALAAFRELAEHKTPTSGRSTLATSHVVQDRFARAEMAVHTGRVLLDEAARQSLSRPSSDGLSALIRMSAASMAESAVFAVNTVFALAGTSAIYETSPIERAFRDIHSATKHISMAATHFEMAGEAMLVGAPLAMRR